MVKRTESEDSWSGSNTNLLYGLDMLLNLAEPLSPHLKTGDDNTNFYRTGKD